MAHGDKAGGNDLLDGVHVGEENVPEPLAWSLKPLYQYCWFWRGGREASACPLSLSPARRGWSDGIAEAPVEEIGPQGVDGAAVGAAKALDPEGMDEAFEVSLDIAVPPDAGRLAGQAAFGLGQGYFLPSSTNLWTSTATCSTKRR